MRALKKKAWFQTLQNPLGMGWQDYMEQTLERKREENEREAYREEAQGSAASMLAMIDSATDNGMYRCLDTNGNEVHAQNTDGSIWGQSTWVTLERSGKHGWQIAGIATHAAG